MSITVNACFRNQVCIPWLVEGQNPDGGWGFHPAAQSAVEPTSWALLALTNETQAETEAIRRAELWLLQAQRQDGSWPAVPGQEEGCWVTALAALALLTHAIPIEPIARGVAWLCNSWPAEGGVGWRLAHRLLGDVGTVQQSFKLRGWSWTPGAASWVEPTSYSLILLRNVPSDIRPRNANRRIKLAEDMLCDRMCPGGGWNSGNPRVLGTDGSPKVGPTVWALLALQRAGKPTECQRSLDWIDQKFRAIRGPGSLALAGICLNSYGITVPAIESSLLDMYGKNFFLRNVTVMAWVALALSGVPRWLRWSS